MPVEDAQNTTTTVSAEAPQPSYVQSLIDTAGNLGEDRSSDDVTQSQPDATDAETEAAKSDTTVTEPDKTETPVVSIDELIQQYAEETGLNPSDPAQRKTLKRLADKELFIRKLQADHEAAKQTTGTADQAAPELMTAFEKELAADTGAGDAAKVPPEAAPVTDKAKVTEQTPVETHGYGDVGDPWKTPEDSLSALNEAWAGNDLKKVHDIEVARLRRNFDSVIAPSLLQYVEKMVEGRLKGFAEKELGDVVPEVRRSVTEKRVAENREFAIGELRKAGATDIDTLFATEDGPPITFEGQQFPNTPLNRILIKHPEIMRIVETHTDPARAERKTFISRYRLAYQLHKQGAPGVTSETAKKLVEAGREAEQRKTTDRARQTLNAGKGATGLGDGKKSGSYVSELNSLPGEVPFGSLIS